jgi:hypothetical protein
MNPNQLATMEEAQAIVRQLGSAGNGVREVYIPEYGGPYSVPEMGNSKFYHLRFNNGAEGFNVGLIRTLIKQCPTTWLNMVTTEISNQFRAMQN